jgi:hypothetical protein
VGAGQRHRQQDGKGHGHLDDQPEPGPPAPRCPFGWQSTSDPRSLSVPEVVGAPGRRRRGTDRNPGRERARRHPGRTPPPAGIDRQRASVSPRTPACTPGRAQSVRRGGPGRSLSSSIGRRRGSQNPQAMPARRGRGGAGWLAGHESRQVYKAAPCESSTHRWRTIQGGWWRPELAPGGPRVSDVGSRNPPVGTVDAQSSRQKPLGARGLDVSRLPGEGTYSSLPAEEELVPGCRVGETAVGHSGAAGCPAATPARRDARRPLRARRDSSWPSVCLHHDPLDTA